MKIEEKTLSNIERGKFPTGFWKTPFTPELTISSEAMLDLQPHIFNAFTSVDNKVTHMTMVDVFVWNVKNGVRDYLKNIALK